MWSGEGWTRTQRIVGVVGLGLGFAAEVGLNADIPVAYYTIVGGLLGLGVLMEALEKLKR